MRAVTKSWSEINPPFLCSPWSSYSTVSAFCFPLASLSAANTRVYSSGGSNSGVEITCNVTLPTLRRHVGGATTILKFGAIWRCVINLTHRPIYQWGNNFGKHRTGD